MAADFDYGNARLRARKASLLDRADYDELLGKDLDGLLGALSETPYRSDVEEAAGRFSDLRALHEAVRRHLARSLEEMRGFYRDSARTLVNLLLSRWDLHNVLTLVRGRGAGLAPEQTLTSIVPIGGLGEGGVAAEVAQQSDAGRAVELLVSWRLPDAELARSLARALPAYLRTDDLAALEHALAADHFDRLRMPLGDRDAAEPLARDLGREVDIRNLLAALRLRDAQESGATGPAGERPAGPFLPGGSIVPEALRAAIEATGPAQAATALAQSVGEPAFRDALERWFPEQGLVVLQAELEARRTRAALDLFRSEDPLGVAVPVAFAAAKESEARNLRLLGDGAARGAEPAELRARLLPTAERAA